MNTDFLWVLVAIVTIQSCHSPYTPKNNHQIMETNTGVINTTTTFEEGRDYNTFTRIKIMDNQGFTIPAEALSILLPEGWKSLGEIFWTPPGQPCAGINMYFNAQSPDGKSTFGILPNYVWSWSPEPQINALGQQQANQYCGVGEPLNASDFLQQVWARELGDISLSEIKENPEAMATMGKNDAKQRAEMMRYGSAGVEFRHTAVTARAKWADGRSGILFCRVTNSVNYIPNKYTGAISQAYTSSASRMIYFFPDTEKNNAEQLITVMIAGIRTNPYWKESTDNFWRAIREQGHAVHLSKIEMMDEQTRQIANRAIQRGNERLAAMDNQARTWEAQQNSNDKIHSDFIKTIREVENYQDANGKVELSAGYNHAWSRGDGSSFIMSNNPNFDAAAVFQDQNWREMKRVD